MKRPRRVVRRRGAALLAAVLLFAAGGAKAELIIWTFEGTVSVQTSDPLGIGSEVIQLQLTFDASDTWVEGTFLFEPVVSFPTVAASAGITGGHTIATKSSAPAARVFRGSGGMSEGIGIVSYVDFIIDGVETITFAADGPVLTPSAGDNLLVAHLRDDLDVFGSLKVDDVFYDLTDRSVTIVPEPGTSLLVTAGLLLLASGRRFERAA